MMRMKHYSEIMADIDQAKAEIEDGQAQQAKYTLEIVEKKLEQWQTRKEA